MSDNRTEIKRIKAEIREVNNQMRYLGIKRFSVFNGGHTSQSYEFNNRLFILKSKLKDLQGKP